jgi:hypothetical protein
MVPYVFGEQNKPDGQSAKHDPEESNRQHFTDLAATPSRIEVSLEFPDVKLRHDPNLTGQRNDAEAKRLQSGEIRQRFMGCFP